LNYEAYRSYHSVNLGAQTAQASPVQLVLILMDGLLEELARARAHIAGRRYEAKANSLNKCVEILNGMAGALDTESGGEVVTNLGRLYDFCASRLNQAGMELSVTMVDEVVSLLETIKQGWQGVQAKHG